MPDKQNRYRERKAEQGLQRVEVLIPQDAAPLLKAYARALRDAYSLGMDAPLFNGMAHNNDRPIDNATARQTLKPNTGDTTKTPEMRTAKRGIKAERQTKPTPKKKLRPDFSKGLLDE